MKSIIRKITTVIAVGAAALAMMGFGYEADAGRPSQEESIQLRSLIPMHISVK